MNKIVVALLIVGAGGAGFLAGRYLTREEARKDNEAEINKLIEYYKKKEELALMEAEEGVGPVDLPEAMKEDLTRYEKEVKENYSDYAGQYQSGDKPKSRTGRPYLITEAQFDEDEDYDVLTLTYFADGMLADDGDNAMGRDEIEASVGLTFSSHFGNGDVVYIRNDERKTNYEILRDERAYEEVVGNRPYLIGG